MDGGRLQKTACVGVGKAVGSTVGLGLGAGVGEGVGVAVAVAVGVGDGVGCGTGISQLEIEAARDSARSVFIGPLGRLSGCQAVGQRIKES